MITRDADHHLYLDGKGPLPSVTRVLGAAVGKDEMLAYVRRQAIEATLGAVTTEGFANVIGNPPRAANEITALVNYLEVAVTKASLAEAEHGRRIHSALERHLKGEPQGQVDDDVIPRLAGFTAWEKKHRPEWHASELAVANAEHFYGGVLDAYGELNDELVLIDFKRGRWGRAEYVLQLNALARCDGLPKFDTGLLLHVLPDKVVPTRVPLTDAAFEAFLACLTTWRWLQSQGA